MDKQWLAITAIAGFLLLAIPGLSALKPLKWLGYGVLQVVVGGVFLYIFNLVGESFQLHIPINPVTALLSGLLGIPGILALAVIKLYVMV